MQLKSSIKVNNGFPELRRKIHEGAVPAALTQAVREGASVSRQIASERKDTGAMSDIKYGKARRDGGKGWNAVIFSKPHYAWFHELGTLGSRKRKLNKRTVARRSSASGQARLAKVAGSEGIQPLNFLGKGRSVARRRLVELLKREIGRIP
jgi:hypothetical protein